MVKKTKHFDINILYKLKIYKMKISNVKLKLI